VSRLPYRVRGLAAEAPGRAARGRVVELDLAIRADGELADHVLRVDVYNPAGEWCYWYSGTVLAAKGRGRHRFWPALNDPVGRWTVTVRDTVTGATAERAIRVTR
jgi:hypothetical protein